jgi:hypothetical protein
MVAVGCSIIAADMPTDHRLKPSAKASGLLWF